MTLESDTTFSYQSYWSYDHWLILFDTGMVLVYPTIAGGGKDLSFQHNYRRGKLPGG